MAQVATKGVSIRKIMARPTFLQGARDAANGLGFCSEYDDFSILDQWTYERGRLFYFATGLKAFRAGTGVTREAIVLYKSGRAGLSIL
jgi:hypothetical protein